MKPAESFSCWAQDWWKAAIPAMMAMIMKARETKLHRMPQHLELPPYRFANTLASELLTLRRMRSSHCVLISYGWARDKTKTYNVPDTVETAHNSDK